MDDKESKANASFPGLSEKLSAPVRQSAFERSKAEAEAKRLRNEAETAAVLEEFKKDFGDDQGGNPSTPRTTGHSHLNPSTGSGFRPGRRHFAANSMSSGPMRKSGPGSLDHLGTPASFKKRPVEGQKPMEPKAAARTRTGPGGIFGDDEDDDEHNDASSVQHASDNSHERRAAERAAAKPTLRLSSLPPTTSQAVINNLFARTNLKVDSVRIVSQASGQRGPSTDRKSMTAIVSFGSDTPASELDKAVTQLRGTYLGWGYKLSLQRHLSSAVLDSTAADPTNLFSSLASHPFGAKPVRNETPAARGPPPHGQRNSRFAPPASYDSPSSRPMERMEVTVTYPKDIKVTRLIHQTIENVEKHGPQFEALLMSRHSVQKDEKWAWLFNARSPEGVYYRYKLMEVLGRRGHHQPAPQQDHGAGRQRSSVRMFHGNPEWILPEDSLPFEFRYSFGDLIADANYDSSEEEDSGDEMGMPRNRRNRREQDRQPTDLTALENIGEEPSFLNPFQKAKLVHLLSRLPTTTGRLRHGDIARVSAFAITHAAAGAEEVVHLLIYNVIQPLNLSKLGNVAPEDEDDEEPMDTADGQAPDEERQEDKSAATMIGLYVLSDILLSSSTSGVHRAWRYRTLIQGELQTYHVFGKLGRLPRDLNWGRLRTEKWTRSVTALLKLWADRNVFSRAEQAAFQKEFDHPPLTEAEQEEERKQQKAKEEAERAKKRQKAQEDKARREKESAEAAEKKKGKASVMRSDKAAPEDGASNTVKAAEGEMGGADAKEGGGAEIKTAAEPSTRAARRPKAEDMFEDSD